MNYEFWHELVSKIVRHMKMAMIEEGLTDEQVDRVFSRMNELLISGLKEEIKDEYKYD